MAVLQQLYGYNSHRFGTKKEPYSRMILFYGLVLLPNAMVLDNRDILQEYF